MWGRALAAVLMLFAFASVATAIEADTSIYLTPSSEHVSFYTNTAYFCCNYTNAESASVTIKFELFDDSSNVVIHLHTLSDIAPGTTAQHNFCGALIDTPGKYRVAMYAPDGSELCAYWVVVRSPTSPNYEKLHGSTRFKNADGVPSVSFAEPMSGRGIVWTTDNISLTHSLELYAFSAGSTAATGTLTFTNNTTDGETVDISTDRYEFDTNGSVASGNIAIDVSGGNNNSSRSCTLFAAAVTASDTVGVGAGCSGSIVTLTADSPGVGGTSITTTETCANATFTSATLTGGSSTAGDVAATGTLTFTNNTTDGETVDISTDRYEFDTNGSVASGNIAIDVSGGNNNSSRSCTLFAAAVTASDTVGVGAGCSGSIVTLTADSPGVGGTSITTTETCANATFTSATLTGGSSTVWNAAAGGSSLLECKNTSGDETHWVRATTYSIGQTYMLLIFSHDNELLDMHLVHAVVPTANVVTIIVKDVETKERIMAFTGNMMDTTKTSTSGEVSWMNVTNGEHMITVTADGYATGTTAIYMANSYINTTIYLQRQSPYYTPHRVQFYLTNILLQPYSDVNVSVAYVSAAGENITLTGVTGTDGAAAFLLTPTFKHTITFTSTSQGIDKTVTLYPTATEYWIIVTAGDGGWADYGHDPTRYIHISVSKHEIDDTHAFINVTYLDDLNMTTTLRMWVNQTDTSDLLGNPLLIDSWDAPANTSSASHSFIVTNYRGQDYMVYVWHEHDEFGTLYSRAVRFIGILIDLGLPPISYAYISFAILFFMAAMFGATSTSIGGITTCVTGWLLYAIGWLGIIGIVAPICLALASTYAVGVMLSDRARKGGYA